ncbi:MAG TPA: hypothetical protein VGR82_10155 [Methylomirabilota bacterium]|nr:hypothetical protein [Methylomirabilota bacterium]
MKKRAPARKAAARKPVAKAKKQLAARKPTAKASTYTPTPIQGIGWAPFRYPLL